MRDKVDTVDFNLGNNHIRSFFEPEGLRIKHVLSPKSIIKWIESEFHIDFFVKFCVFVGVSIIEIEKACSLCLIILKVYF